MLRHGKANRNCISFYCRIVVETRPDINIFYSLEVQTDGQLGVEFPGISEKLYMALFAPRILRGLHLRMGAVMGSNDMEARPATLIVKIETDLVRWTAQDNKTSLSFQNLQLS